MQTFNNWVFEVTGRGLVLELVKELKNKSIMTQILLCWNFL